MDDEETVGASQAVTCRYSGYRISVRCFSVVPMLVAPSIDLIGNAGFGSISAVDL
jgi:hypothetical protein